MERLPLKGVDRDYPILIAVISVMVCIIVAFPVNYNPFRQHFFSLYLGRDEFTFKENVILTAIFQAITCFLSIIFPKISSVISIMGGLIAVSMCYLIPVICLIKLGKGSMIGKIFATLFFGTLILIGYTSVGITIYEVVNGLDKMPRNNE